MIINEKITCDEKTSKFIILSLNCCNSRLLKFHAKEVEISKSPTFCLIAMHQFTTSDVKSVNVLDNH
jgi:hypothetical protein